MSEMRYAARFGMSARHAAFNGCPLEASSCNGWTLRPANFAPNDSMAHTTCKRRKILESMVIFGTPPVHVCHCGDLQGK